LPLLLLYQCVYNIQAYQKICHADTEQSEGCLIADNWSEKACRRRTQGVGRMRYMKKVFRRFRYAD